MRNVIVALCLVFAACEVNMDGVRHPLAPAVMPAFTADGTAGWADDGVPFPPQAYNHMRAELDAILNMFGAVAEDPTDGGQIADVLAPHVLGILSSATDTGTVTTPHTRVVVGATASRASGENAQVSGGFGNTASGTESQVSGGVENLASGANSQVSGGHDNLASGANSQVSGGHSNLASGDYSQVSGGAENTASGDYSQVSGGRGNTASGGGSGVAVGSVNCENGTPYSLAGGYSATPITVNPAVPTNQNLLWMLKDDTGLLSLKMDNTTVAAFDAGTNWTATNNRPHGRVTVANAGSMALPVGGTFTVTLANSLVADADFTLTPVVRSNTIVAVVPVSSASAAGSNVFTFMNIGTAALIGDAWGVEFKFVATGTL